MRQWPLVGRSTEMASVREALAQSGDTRGVAITGPAGVGKTRLADEAERLLRRDGSGVRRLIATAASRQLPLGVFAPVLGEASGDPLRIAHQVTTAVSSSGCSALVVDDAHLLDGLSAAVLLQLVATGDLRAVVTVRSGSDRPDAVGALWKDGYLDQLQLGPLSPTATIELTAAAMEGGIAPEVTGRFADLCGGNPLYLRQMIIGEIREARLTRAEDGSWTWHGPFRATAELADLVEATALAVPDPVRDVLDLLAVTGDLDLDMLLACAEQSEVEAAEEAGLVVVDKNAAAAKVRPAHPLYAEVRRARIGEVAGRRLRGRVAAALSDGVDRDADRLRRAALLIDSDQTADADVYAGAAEQAIRLFDYPLGERLAEAAVAAGGGFGASVLLAFAQGWCHHRDAATQTCERLLATSGNDLERIQASIVTAAHQFFLCEQPEEALALMRRAREQIQHPAAPTALDCMLAFLLACLGESDAAVRVGRRALEQPGLAPLLEVSAAAGLLGGLCFTGELDEVEQLGERCWLVGANAFDSANFRLAATYLQICGLLAAGEIGAAEKLVRARAEAITPGTPAGAMSAAFRGLAALAAGDVGRACDQLRRCRIGARQDTSGWRYHAIVLSARAEALAGRVDEAVRQAALADSIQHPGHRWFEPERLLSRAWVAATQGGLTQAVRLARQAARWAADHQQHAYQVVALHTVVRFGRGDVAGDLAALAKRVDGPRAGAAARHAHAMTIADPDRMLAAAEELQTIGDRLAAADAYAHASILLRSQGRPGSRIDALRKASSLQQICGAVTPALRSALRPLPLAAREREVATLAAYGRSNRAIADELGLSIRTVEGHLYRASGRLGISSRSQLAAHLCLGPDDLRPDLTAQ